MITTIVIIIISKLNYTTIVPFPLINDTMFTLQRYRNVEDKRLEIFEDKSCRA